MTSVFAKLCKAVFLAVAALIISSCQKERGRYDLILEKCWNIKNKNGLHFGYFRVISMRDPKAQGKFNYIIRSDKCPGLWFNVDKIDHPYINDNISNVNLRGIPFYIYIVHGSGIIYEIDGDARVKLDNVDVVEKLNKESIDKYNNEYLKFQSLQNKFLEISN